MPDLRPKPDATIEWWFVQGRIDKGVESAIHFMVAFFQVRQNAGRATVGHMILANAVDDTGAQRLLRSDISPEIVEMHRAVATRVIATRFSPALVNFILRGHMEESEKLRCENGPQILKSAASLASDGLAISWDGFDLRDEGDGLRLRLAAAAGAADDLAADLRLTPNRAWMNETGANLSPDRPQPYSYLSCPRAELAGTLDGRPVSGTAWIDRQWSGTFDNWFVAGNGRYLQALGWDWLGFSLDNGIDVMAHQRTVENGRPVGPSTSVVFLDDVAERHESDFQRLDEKHWTSPRSGVVYPIARRLVLPAFGADLHVVPIATDQEVPVFGAPSIWEGAVRVSGCFDGRTVEGYGRLELFGYGYTETLPKFLLRKARQAMLSKIYLPRKTAAGERDAV